MVEDYDKYNDDELSDFVVVAGWLFIVAVAATVAVFFKYYG